MTDSKNNRKGSWAPLPGVTSPNFRGYPLGGPSVYWPPLWWRRWGRRVFVHGAAIGFWIIVLRAALAGLH